MRAALVAIGLMAVPFIAGAARADDLDRWNPGSRVPRLFEVHLAFDDGTEIAAFGEEWADGSWRGGEVRITVEGREVRDDLGARQFRVDPSATRATLEASVEPETPDPPPPSQAGCVIRFDLISSGVPQPRLIPAHAIGVEVTRGTLAGKVELCGNELGPVRRGEIRSILAAQFSA